MLIFVSVERGEEKRGHFSMKMIVLPHGITWYKVTSGSFAHLFGGLTVTKDLFSLILVSLFI